MCVRSTKSQERYTRLQQRLQAAITYGGRVRHRIPVNKIKSPH
ncbi:MAG: hypothetical protein V7L29_01025 [Nostoc sp.]